MSENLDRARTSHEQIRTALIERWDPIGVREIPEARGEYDHYVPSIYRMLITRCSKQEIFDYLWWLETEHMGLNGDMQTTKIFVDYLYSLGKEIETPK